MSRFRLLFECVRERLTGFGHARRLHAQSADLRVKPVRKSANVVLLRSERRLRLVVSNHEVIRHG